MARKDCSGKFEPFQVHHDFARKRCKMIRKQVSHPSEFTRGVEMDPKEAFLTAIKAGEQDKVDEYLQLEPGLANTRTEQGLSAILLAMYHNQPGIARSLAARTAGLDVFEAAALGHLDRVAELVEADPDLVNAFAQDGFQPLGLASYFGHLTVVEYLLVKGAEVNSPSRNASRVMPLHSAVAHQHLEIAQALLEQDADPNATQAGEFTPLHAAAQNGQVEMVRLLLDYGAKVNTPTEDKRTPLSFALEQDHREAAELLRQHGARLP
jgi:ankyrin repeat protein